MAINVKLKGSTVTIDPNPYEVNQGNHEVKWKPHDDSDTFDFNTTPIVFDDSTAPMSDPTPNGDTATCDDNNQNTNSQAVNYTYHVCLIDAHGNHITYPPINNPTADGNPTITNKPK